MLIALGICVLAIIGLCCCVTVSCEADLDGTCEDCCIGNAPAADATDQIKVIVRGVQNDNCTDCLAVNGTWICDYSTIVSDVNNNIYIYQISDETTCFLSQLRAGHRTLAGKELVATITGPISPFSVGAHSAFTKAATLPYDCLTMNAQLTFDSQVETGDQQCEFSSASFRIKCYNAP